MKKESSRSNYTDEFKRDAVELWRQSDETKSAVAKRLGIDPGSMSNWIRQADIDEGKREGLTSDERDELVRLRKENKTLQMERDLMKKAAAFFANHETK